MLTLAKMAIAPIACRAARRVRGFRPKASMAGFVGVLKRVQVSLPGHHRCMAETLLDDLQVSAVGQRPSRRSGTCLASPVSSRHHLVSGGFGEGLREVDRAVNDDVTGALAPSMVA